MGLGPRRPKAVGRGEDSSHHETPLPFSGLAPWAVFDPRGGGSLLHTVIALISMASTFLAVAVSGGDKLRRISCGSGASEAPT